MSKKHKRIPDLRFPEFKDEEEWEFLKGNKIFEPISNKNHSSDLPILAVTQDNGAVPRDLINYHVSVTDKSVENYKVVEIGDFIISLRSFQGGIEYSGYRGLCSPAYTILRKKTDVVNDFYRHFFKSFLFIRDLNKNLEGIRDGKMISYKQFSEITIPKPNNAEQQKIAACLSFLDEVIAAHSEKLELLKEHKKGLMQKLFPGEGKKVPEYRFKEFEGDGEWVGRRLEETGEIITGNTPSTKLAENYNGERLFVSPADIGNNRYINDTKTKLTDFGFSKTRPIKANSVLFVCIGSTIGKIAQNKVECATNQQINSIVPSNEFASDFLYSMLQNASSAISELAGVQAVPIINKSQFSAISLLFPNYDEQQKIASCLSSLDEILLAQTEKIEQLKQHKNGLMQRLFPAVN